MTERRVIDQHLDHRRDQQRPRSRARSRSLAITPSGVNAGMITFEPPLSSSEYIAAPLARWNIGAACR